MNVAEWMDVQVCGVCQKPAKHAARDVIYNTKHDDLNGSWRFGNWRFGCDEHPVEKSKELNSEPMKLSKKEITICKNCQYFRPANFIPSMQKPFCSNSKSDHALHYVLESDTCDHFYKHGKKAPLWMLALKKAIK